MEQSPSGEADSCTFSHICNTQRLILWILSNLNLFHVRVYFRIVNLTRPLHEMGASQRYVSEILHEFAPILVLSLTSRSRWFNSRKS